jgi:hypothetical protein
MIGLISALDGLMIDGFMIDGVIHFPQLGKNLRRCLLQAQHHLCDNVALNFVAACEDGELAMV